MVRYWATESPTCYYGFSEHKSLIPLTHIPFSIQILSFWKWLPYKLEVPISVSSLSSIPVGVVILINSNESTPLMASLCNNILNYVSAVAVSESSIHGGCTDQESPAKGL